MIRRINLFGGPGVGKSTIASYLFSEFKQQNYSVEYVTEYVKLYTYTKPQIKPFNQVLFFAKQMYLEETYLENGVSFIITDSPIVLPIFYSKDVNDVIINPLYEIAYEFEKKYPSVNILLKRIKDNSHFSQLGRFHTYEDSVHIDDELKSFLKDYFIKYQEMDTENKDSILDYVNNLI